MLNCRQTTELVSHSLDRKLSFGQKIKLKLHLMMCPHCRNYAKQLRLMQRFSRHMNTHIENQTQYTLPNATKAKIKKNLTP